MTISGRAAAYASAAVIGGIAVFLMLTWPTLCGSGGVFTYPQADLPTNLIGHLAFQDPGWHWPLLRAPRLGWPAGESIAMTDSNPALSIVAKLLAAVLRHAVNLFGVWLGLCFFLQPIGGVYLLRGFGVRNGVCGFNAWAAAVAMAILSLLLPAYLFRTNHINLMGQFLLLAALGLAVRNVRADRAPRFGRLLGFLSLAVLVHPYLFIFCAITLMAPAVHLLVRRLPGARAAVREVLLAAQLPIGLFLLLSYSLGGGGNGFGYYSTNLLSPVWPQISGLFGPNLPILNATGLQYEGFNYLGAGILLLLSTALGCFIWQGAAARKVAWRRQAGLILVLAALGFLALTPRVMVGHYQVLLFWFPGIDRLFSPVRASGRAIWVVDYAVIAASLALLAAHLRPVMFGALLAMAVTLQWVDSGPLRHRAQHYFAGAGQTPPPLTLPAATQVFRAVHPCEKIENPTIDTYRLLALRQGIALADVRLAHPMLDEVCRATLAQGLTMKLAPGEVRLFLPGAALRADPSKLGAGVQCSTGPAGLLCVLEPKPG